MYYLELIDRFWAFNESVKLSPSSTTLYFYLLKTAQDFNHYQFAVSDIELGKQLSLNRATIKTAKEKLRDCGLISFEMASGSPCRYRLLVDYPLELEKSKLVGEFPMTPELIKKEVNVELPLEQESLTDDVKVISENSVIVMECLDISKNMPELADFLEYAKSLESYKHEMDPLILEKYLSWKGSGWKNSSGRYITNWRASLKNILPFLNPVNADGLTSISEIPLIRRPD